MPTSIVSPFLNEMTLISPPDVEVPGRAISMAAGLMHFPSRQINFMASPPVVAESYTFAVAATARFHWRQNSTFGEILRTITGFHATISANDLQSGGNGTIDA